MASSRPSLLRADGKFGSQTVGILQAFLKTSGEDPGPIDGSLGAQTKAALLAFLQKQGYGSDDGGGDGKDSAKDWELCVRALQQWLADSGFPPRGGSDGVWGFGTTISLQEFLNTVEHIQFGPVPENGEMASATGRAFQYYLMQQTGMRVPVDGTFGSKSRRLLQTFLKARGFYEGDVDGLFHGVAVRALRSWLKSIGFPAAEAEGGTETDTWEAETTVRIQQFLNTLTNEVRVVTLTCAVQGPASVEITCTSMAGESLAVLQESLQTTVGSVRKTLSAKLELPEHRIELVLPAGGRLRTKRTPLAELLGAELLAELLAGRIKLPGSHSKTGFLTSELP